MSARPDCACQKGRPESWSAAGIHDSAAMLQMQVANHLLTLGQFTLMMCFQPGDRIQVQTTFVDMDGVLNSHVPCRLSFCTCFPNCHPRGEEFPGKHSTPPTTTTQLNSPS